MRNVEALQSAAQADGARLFDTLTQLWHLVLPNTPLPEANASAQYKYKAGGTTPGSGDSASTPKSQSTPPPTPPGPAASGKRQGAGSLPLPVGRVVALGPPDKERVPVVVDDADLQQLRVRIAALEDEMREWCFKFETAAAGVPVRVCVCV